MLHIQCKKDMTQSYKYYNAYFLWIWQAQLKQTSSRKSLSTHALPYSMCMTKLQFLKFWDVIPDKEQTGENKLLLHKFSLKCTVQNDRHWVCPYQSLEEYAKPLMTDFSECQNDVDEGTQHSQAFKYHTNLHNQTFFYRATLMVARFMPLSRVCPSVCQE